MSDKIPSSLKWLVTKRARLAGELKKAESLHSKKIQHSLMLIEAIKIDIATIDKTIRLHEIQLNPELIPVIKTQTNAPKFKHGMITRGIYACLRQANNAALSTTQIALSLSPNLTEEENFYDLRYIVRQRLKALCKDEKIERVPRAAASIESYWRIKNWDASSLGSGRPKICTTTSSAIPSTDDVLENTHATNAKGRS